MNFLFQLVRLPRFEDEDKNRAAILLHFILLAVIIINVLVISADLFLQNSSSFSTAMHIFALAPVLMLYMVLRRGYVRLTGIFLCGMAWFLVSFSATFDLGIMNPVYVGQVLTITVAGLVISGRAAIGTAALSIFYGVGLLYAAEIGHYPTHIATVTAREVWINNSAIFILSGLLLYLSLRSIQEARQRAAEKADELRRRENHYRSLIQTAPATIMTLNPAHEITSINRSGFETPELTAGRSIYDFLLIESYPRAAAALKRVFTQGKTEEVEILGNNSSGQPAWYLSRMAPIRVDGGISEAAVITTDITERKRMEEQYRQLFESNPHPMFVTDIETQRFLAVNQAAVVKYGYNRNEFLRLTTNDLRPQGDNASAAQVVERYKHEKLSYLAAGVWRHIKKDGSIISVELTLNRLTYEGRDAVVATCYDLTERLQAEEAMRRSEALFSTIFQSVPVAILIATIRDGRILNVNRHFLALTGYEAGEVIDRSLSEVGALIPQNQRFDWAKVVRQNISVSEVEGRWRTKQGDVLEILMSLEPIEISDEACILGIGVDITERKRLEQERMDAEKLRLALDKDREVLELKERFISTMSHEYRTPLAIIMGSKEALEHYYDRLPVERRLEHFRNIEEQVRYVTMLLDDVLTLNIVRSGNLRFTPLPLDLSAFCEKLLRQIQLTDTRQHRFAFLQNGRVGEMRGDKNLLQHILINLLSNAVKYSPEGGEIRLELHQGETDVIIQVSDQGMGIPVEDQSRLFEAFYRASNTGQIKGTGLGLAIVKESVQVHGGTIAFESVPGRGTTFTVCLPV